MKRKGSDIRSFFSPARKVGDQEAEWELATAEGSARVTVSSSLCDGEDGGSAHVSSSPCDREDGGVREESVAESHTASAAGFMDIGSFVGSCEEYYSPRKLSDELKLKIIEHRKPGSHIKMPSQVQHSKSCKDGVRMRYCNRSWFDTFKFTAYSQLQKGIFCLPCVLFPVPQSTSGRAQILITKPLVNWKDAITHLTTHQSLDYHLFSEAQMEAFMKTMKDPSKRLDATVSQQARTNVRENRAKLVSIVKCLEFCGRHGIALRGHRDDGVVLDDNITRHGKFKALVNFRVDAGDEVLKKHLAETCKRETYISKTSQNALLDCMGEHICNRIAEEVRQSGFFSVSADEVTDVSNWEQLGIVLRYIKDNQAVEKLVGFVACQNVRGADIFTAIKIFLLQLGLDISLCRGQGYDGAGAMAGKLRGCQALFRAEVPEAKYFHCTSHQLNLALSKACTVPEIHRMVECLKKLGIFFKYSPKKQRALEKSISHTNDRLKLEGKPEIGKVKFKLLCQTRWIERHTALEDFHDLVGPIAETLESISQRPIGEAGVEWDVKSKTEAAGLLHDLRSSEFLVALYTCRYFFAYTKDVARLLQGASMDVLTAYQQIADVRECIHVARIHAEERFSAVYQQVLETAELIGCDVTIPRRCASQRHRSNYPAISVEEYWRRSIFIAFSDQLALELKERFNELSATALSGLCLLPKKATLPHGITNALVANLQTSFSRDLPATYSLPQEVDRWVKKWQKVAPADVPTSLSDTLKSTDSLAFPNIHTILRLLLVAPVTSASVERANSALAYVKTELRSMMGQDRLNSLILLYVHKDIQLNYDEVVDAFAARAPRRMLLVDACNHEEDEY